MKCSKKANGRQTVEQNVSVIQNKQINKVSLLVERIRAEIQEDSALFDTRLKLGTNVTWYIAITFQPGDNLESCSIIYCYVTKKTIYFNNGTIEIRLLMTLEPQKCVCKFIL